MPVPDKSSSHARCLHQVFVDATAAEAETEPDAESQAYAGADEAGSEATLATDYAATHQIDSISRVVLETVGEGIFCTLPDGTTSFVNPAAAKMLGWAPEDLTGRRAHDIVHQSYPDGSPYPIASCPISFVLNTGRAQHCEDEVFWRRDGSSFPVSYTSTPIMTEGGIAGSVVVFQDISERVRRDRWQRSKDAIFQAITTHALLEGTLQMLADAYTAFQPGCSVAILLREHADCEDLFLAAGSALPTALRAQLQRLRIDVENSACGHAAITGEEVIVDSRNASPDCSRYLEMACTTNSNCFALPMIAADRQVLGVVAFIVPTRSEAAASPLIPFPLSAVVHPPLAVAEHGRFRGVRDLAQIAVEHRNLQIEIVRQSQHDRLTGLPNWLLMEERLNALIRAADRDKKRIAVCSVDLDRFRRINENHGHVAGDEMLQRIAARFRSVLRKNDTLGRQGGDEFIIFVPELSEPSDADSICRKLLATLNEPFHIDGKSVTIAANIGISIYPDHADTPEQLIQHADTALDFAKAKGQAKLKLFRPDLGQKVRQLAARETALQTALQKNELYLMYQPLFDRNRQVHGFEALLRWQHPELGLIPPDQFIPLAEETGLILPIGDWVLREACRQAMCWKCEALAGTKIFVNISALQLGQADFTQCVGYALKISGLPPARLELEVTESFIVPSFKKATQRLQPLQDLGVSIAIDDFGTGHSSFSVLHKLPINALKVDRSFVSRIDKDPSGLSTVRAIINLAHQLGMKTVGEGVETESQFKLLHEMECDFYQGYLLSKPLTVESVDQVFGDGGRAAAAEALSIKTTSISNGPVFRRSA